MISSPYLALHNFIGFVIIDTIFPTLPPFGLTLLKEEKGLLFFENNILPKETLDKL